MKARRAAEETRVKVVVAFQHKWRARYRISRELFRSRRALPAHRQCFAMISTRGVRVLVVRELKIYPFAVGKKRYRLRTRRSAPRFVFYRGRYVASGNVLITGELLPRDDQFGPMKEPRDKDVGSESQLLAEGYVIRSTMYRMCRERRFLF